MFGKWLTKDEIGAAATPRYADELLSANWNPVIDLLARTCSLTPERVTQPSPDERAADTEGFLNRVYTLGV